MAHSLIRGDVGESERWKSVYYDGSVKHQFSNVSGLQDSKVVWKFGNVVWDQIMDVFYYLAKQIELHFVAWL